MWTDVPDELEICQAWHSPRRPCVAFGALVSGSASIIARAAFMLWAHTLAASPLPPHFLASQLFSFTSYIFVRRARLREAASSGKSWTFPPRLLVCSRPFRSPVQRKGNMGVRRAFVIDTPSQGLRGTSGMGRPV
ncbi:hypothetical protein OH77DRAFT_261067 [Trametes cingulata]|nr:hypothetical protein OH77DRAFT_261067 [Trametes cingulata]